MRTMVQNKKIELFDMFLFIRAELETDYLHFYKTWFRKMLI